MERDNLSPTQLELFDKITLSSEIKAKVLHGATCDNDITTALFFLLQDDEQYAAVTEVFGKPDTDAVVHALWANLKAKVKDISNPD